MKRSPSRKKTVRVNKQAHTKKKPASRKMAYNPPILHIRVFRFNSQMDFTPRTHEYSISPKQGESILDLLTRIKHTQDGSLTFRGSCGYGGCGSCGVKVNGKPVLGCVTQVSDVVDAHQTLRIDPLDEKQVIKDLVVDEKPFFDELLAVKPWLVPRIRDEKRHHKMGQQAVEKLGNAQQCILCGLCNANTTSSKTGELSPASFVKGFRYASDVRDGDEKRWEKLGEKLPVHYSLLHANLCPRDIFPGDKIAFIQRMQTNKKEQGERRQGKA